MISAILIVFGLLHFTDAIFKKHSIYERIELLGAMSKSKFIYNLTFCRFCLQFHLCWIITIIYGAFSAFSFDLLVVPFVVLGLTHKFKENDL